MIGKMYEARKKSVGAPEGSQNALKINVDKMSELKSRKEIKEGTGGEIMTEIMPCPFCGGNGVVKTSYSQTKCKYFTFIKCVDCYAQTKGISSTKEPDDSIIRLATNAWNLRNR